MKKQKKIVNTIIAGTAVAGMVGGLIYSKQRKLKKKDLEKKVYMFSLNPCFKGIDIHLKGNKMILYKSVVDESGVKIFTMVLSDIEFAQGNRYIICKSKNEWLVVDSKTMGVVLNLKGMKYR